MTDTNAKVLSKALAHTRDSLKDVCYPLGIEPSSVDLSTLSVQQCESCSVWAEHLIEGVCSFCDNIDTLRF